MGQMVIIDEDDLDEWKSKAAQYDELIMTIDEYREKLYPTMPLKDAPFNVLKTMYKNAKEYRFYKVKNFDANER